MRVFKRSRFQFQCFLFGIGVVFFLLACDRLEPKPSVEMQSTSSEVIKTIRIFPNGLELAIDQTQMLSVMLGDNAGNMLNSNPKSGKTIADKKGRAGQYVKWTSNQPSIAKVDADGLVTALAEGMVEITASSEGVHESVKIIVSARPVLPVSVSPIRAIIATGESLQLIATFQDARGNEPGKDIIWSSNKPSLAMVSQNGLVTASQPGDVIISVRSKKLSGHTYLTISPAKTISGLDFPGSAGTSKTMRFAFTSPLAAYPATYIWRSYPRQQLSYYTAFFWGNNGQFYNENTYYGFHPYPDWDTASQHFWEIAAPPGGDFLNLTHVIYDRWYIQVAICKQEGNKIVEEFYWDWPNTTKVIRHLGEKYSDPPHPGLIVGDAPWNQGNEVWDGVLRGFQFYNVAMRPEDIAKEIDSPGSQYTPWYLNINPTPDDISDKSGNAHHPSWAGAERPGLWRGKMVGGGIIRTVVPPR